MRTVVARISQELETNRRNFFWDSITVAVVLVILGLTTNDFLTEVINASTMDCYFDTAIGQEGIMERYIRQFCS